jgi:hypothetical protein
MQEERIKIYPLNGKVININDPIEVNDLCSILGCYDFQLKHAVYRVGNYFEDVKEYFGES